MNVSQQMIKVIQRYEGCALTPYLCPAGKRTIGYGHVISSIEEKKGELCVDTGNGILWIPFTKGLNQAQATVLLQSDLRRYESAVTRNVRVRVSQSQFDALVSLCFNIGVGAFLKSTLLRKLNEGDDDGATDEFLKWNKAGGRVLAGLQRRRAKEAELYRSAAA